MVRAGFFFTAYVSGVISGYLERSQCTGNISKVRVGNGIGREIRETSQVEIMHKCASWAIPGGWICYRWAMI